MSGPFGSSQWMYQSAAGFYPYQIEQSLRFNDNDSAYLSRTPASAGNRKTWTWSGWVKRGNITSQQVMLGINSASTNIFTLTFLSGDTLRVFNRNAGVDVLNITTSALYRDVSAWYHIVVVIDTTQATAADRARLYVNGVEVTAFGTATYPTQNTDLVWNSNSYSHDIGRESTGNYFDGYMAEVNFIDGTALTPTSFGEFKSGIWVPKAYSGAYGTNGFYLSFADSAAIGDDLSGNGNDWTANNLVATDVLLDSPTENWCVLNRNEPQSNQYTFSEGNLKVVSPSTGFPYLLSTMYVASGKWYGEFLLNSSSGFELVGIETAPFYGNKLIGADADGWGYASWNGNYFNNNSGTSYGNTYTTNDIIGVALDLDNGYLYFSKNGVWQNSGDPASGASGTGGIDISSIAGTAVSMGVSDNDNGGSSTFTANFGQDSSFAGATTAGGNTDANGLGNFKYSVPANYLSLNTANLPDPVIDPAQDDVPADYFNTVLWSGDGTSPRSISGVGFQPDLVWGKVRNYTYDHLLYDAVRGAGITKAISSSNTAAEGSMGDNATNGYVSAFETDGFSVIGSGDPGYWNSSGETYVAWNWKAAGAGVANTDGTISSTVSANQKAGFSIVSYTGTGSAATVGHGLGAAPDVLLVKDRSQSVDWQVYHSANTSAPETDYLILNQNLATIDTAATWNDTAPTSSVFTVGTGVAVNTNGNNYIAYCFAEVEGYSKFGSYTGNGSTDGPFVYCGFRPAWVLWKRTDSTADWTVFDTSRGTYNVVGPYLTPNTSDTELTDSTVQMDFLSNGFKVRGTWQGVNASGGTIIFMAFAESPFKFSNAR